MTLPIFESIFARTPWKPPQKHKEQPRKSISEIKKEEPQEFFNQIETFMEETSQRIITELKDDPGRFKMEAGKFHYPIEAIMTSKMYKSVSPQKLKKWDQLIATLAINREYESTKNPQYARDVKNMYTYFQVQKKIHSITMEHLKAKEKEAIEAYKGQLTASIQEETEREAAEKFSLEKKSAEEKFLQDTISNEKWEEDKEKFIQLTLEKKLAQLNQPENLLNLFIQENQAIYEKYETEVLLEYHQYIILDKKAEVVTSDQIPMHNSSINRLEEEWGNKEMVPNLSSMQMPYSDKNK